jgi:hypothetical protein
VNDKKSGEFHYRLASKSREDIERIRQEAEKSEGILNVEVRLYN